MERINKIEFDLNYLNLVSLNINQILTLIKIYFNSKKQFFDYIINNEDLKYLKDQKFIFIYENKNIKYHIRDKGFLILNKIINFKTQKLEITKNNSNIINHNDEINLKKFREKFKNLKPGSMGLLESVRTKLKRWMKNNPKISFNQILEATDYYIDSLNGNYNFVQRADYFIYKQNNKKEEDSRLSLFVEEILKEPVNSDWGSEIK